MAGSTLLGISQDEREQAVFRSRRMYQTDLQSNLATAEDRGRKQGLKEGKREGIREGKIEGINEAKIIIAEKALRMNMDIENIVTLTGLSPDEINELI